MLTKLFSRDGPRSLALILLATFACLALAPFLFPDTCSVDTAAMAGSLNAIWLRYVGPDTALSFENMVDILLMVVIGGMGTIYGGVIGATLFILALSHLQDLMGAASGTLAEVPLLPDMLDPDRWLLWLGVLFVLSVYFFPTGITGRLRGE